MIVNKFIIRTCLLLLPIAFFSGCSTIPTGTVASVPEWHIYEGTEGTPVDWEQLMESVFKADIIVMGEQHNDPVGHELERKLTVALLEKYPDSAVAMEMFERNEQSFVDLYLNDEIEAKTLVKITNSANWGGGKDTWNDWYQPIVDAVKANVESGAGLKAANSPRPYVTLARLEGFEVLESIQANKPGLFSIPDLSVDDSDYHDRFVDFMSGPAESKGEKKGMEKKKTKKSKTDTPMMPPMHIDPEAFFRAQQTWDASMAMSVIEARQQHTKVVLMVGEFHMAFEGGLICRLRAADPSLTLLTISMLQSEENGVNPDDLHRANYIIYTR